MLYHSKTVIVPQPSSHDIYVQAFTYMHIMKLKSISHIFYFVYLQYDTKTQWSQKNSEVTIFQRCENLYWVDIASQAGYASFAYFCLC